ncbi:hypothetical protein ACS0TY_031586 [Phlomoides rotata]
MPQLSEKELEEQLAEAGKTLVSPLPPLDQLRLLLDEIEGLLSKVEQSPAKSMQNALSPLMKALVMEDLLKHSDVEVKVDVASCISEITRITAPDAPYDDDKMKDVFRLIVSSFENFSDTSRKSYEKRTTILETVAKVRSCVIMLDLECDQMIIEMFQHFLKAIREDHTDIFSSMETIMTLVLEESEDISPELLAPILATLKRNDEAVMPITKKLAERVLQNSADKLRPYLRQAVKSLGTSLDDYCEVVSCVCGENIDTVGHSNESILNDQSVVEGKCSSASPAQDPITQACQDGSEETNIQDEDLTATRSPKSVVSNGGIKETGYKEIMVDANSPKRADSNGQLDAKSNIKTESDDGAAEKPVNSEEKLGVVESQQVLDNHEIPDKDVQLSPTEVTPVEADKSEDKVEESIVNHSPSKEPENESVIVSSPIQSGSHSEENRSGSDILGKGKGNLLSEEIVSDTASKKASEGESISEAKKKRRLGKKRTDDSADNDKTLTEEVVSKNDDESDILGKGKSNIVGEEMVSDTASKKASEGESISEAKRKRRLGKKRTDDSADNDKTLTEEVVSKNDDESDILGKGKSNIVGEVMVSDTASKKASEGESISEAKRRKRRLGKKRTDDSADNDKTLTEEVVSKNDDESDILGKGKSNIVGEEMVSDTASKKASEGESISEANKKPRSGKKRADDSADNDKTLTEEVVSKNDDGGASDSEARSLDETEKTVYASNRTESRSSLRKEDGKKSGRAKPTSEKDVRRSSAREDHGKDIVTSRKSPLKSTKKEGTLEETPKMSNKRKHTPGKEKPSETSEYGDNLVGSKVKVWWPKDRMFYEGIIASFDSAKKKHRVSYTDGDEEVLNLKKERWEFIGGDMVSDEDQEIEHSSHDTSSDMKRKKKGNANSETSSKRQKVEGSPKSKPKGTAPKSGGKSKDDGKAESESKDNYSKPSKKSEDDSIKSKDQSQKLGGKGQVDTGKASGKSKDEVAKVSSQHSKQDSQRSSKSKGKTPQTKSGSSKVKEIDLMKEKTGESAKSSETAKGKSTDTAKSRDSETKSGKKRRR